MWTLHEGDCLDIMRSLPDASVDAVITDPPYGISYTRHIPEPRFSAIANDDAPAIEWLGDAFRVLRDGSPLVCFHRWDVAEVFRSSIAAEGLNVRSQLVWAKGGGGLGDVGTCFAPSHELAWFATKGNYTFPRARPSSVIAVPRVPSCDMQHPTEKPVALMAHLIRHLTNEGDTILDPFAGSGSTLLAAESLDRNSIGCELDPRYCDIIRRRMSAIQPTLL